MKYFAISIMTIALFAPAAQGASFDCAEAATEIERMICGDEELSALDETLGDRYVRALAKTRNPPAIQAMQREWLRGPRAACADTACMKTAYAARIAELTKIGWMTHTKAREICDRVAIAVYDGSYRQSFRNLNPGDVIRMDPGPGLHGYHPPPSNKHLNYLDVDYNGDGKIEKLGINGRWSQDSRSCPTYPRMIFDATKKGAEAPPVDKNRPEETHEFLIVDGEPVLARTPPMSGAMSDQAMSRAMGDKGLTLDWLAPDGTQRTLCSIHVSYARRFTTAMAENPKLCRAVAESSVDFLPWRPNVRENLFEGVQEIYRAVRETSRMSVDLDLDGEIDNILSIRTQRRCAAPVNRLAEVSTDFTSLEDTVLSNILIDRLAGVSTDFASLEEPVLSNILTNKGRDWTPLLGSGHDDWDRPRIFLFDGKPYVLGRDNSEKESQAVGNTAVISLWAGTERAWCLYKYPLLPSNVHSSVSVVWPQSN